MVNTTNDLRGLWRGKRIDNGAWVVGYYVKYPVCYNETLHLIIGLDGQYNKIDPLTLGECTGIPDTNDKPIFDGDILSCENEREYQYQVKWNQWNAEFICQSTDGFSCHRGVGDVARRDYIVIGNIFDNPELLVERR